jgi:hypothetical protein
MPRWGNVTKSIWNDPEFRELDDPTRILWLFLLTGPQTTNLPGLFVAGELEVADRANLTPEDVRKGFRELFRLGWARVCERSRLVWIPKRINHDPPANPNVVKSWRGPLEELPASPLLQEAFEYYHSFFSGLDSLQEALKGLRERFAKPYPKGMAIPDSRLPTPDSRLPNTHTVPVGSADERPSVCVSDPPEQTQALVLAAPSPRRSPPRVSDADVRAVLEHYRGYHPRMSARLGKDSKEYKLIVDRMREGATVETCCRAIDGNHLSPLHSGENERGKKYHALTLIFRTASYVSDFAELADAGPQPVVSEQTRRQMRATETPFDIDAVLGPKRKTLEAPRDES